MDFGMDLTEILKRKIWRLDNSVCYTQGSCNTGRNFVVMLYNRHLIINIIQFNSNNVGENDRASHFKTYGHI